MFIMGKGVLDLDKKKNIANHRKKTHIFLVVFFFLDHHPPNSKMTYRHRKISYWKEGDILWMVGGFQLSREVPSGKLT